MALWISRLAYLGTFLKLLKDWYWSNFTFTSQHRSNFVVVGDVWSEVDKWQAWWLWWLSWLLSSGLLFGSGGCCCWLPDWWGWGLSGPAARIPSSSGTDKSLRVTDVGSKFTMMMMMMMIQGIHKKIGWLFKFCVLWALHSTVPPSSSGCIEDDD